MESMIRNGQITDAQSLAAWTLLQLYEQAES
jgi:urease accessory protein UreF